MANSRYEELMTKLLNDETLDNYEPQSRTEAYLQACIQGTTEGLPEPQSRSDALLGALAEKLANGGNTEPYNGEVEVSG